VALGWPEAAQWESYLLNEFLPRWAALQAGVPVWNPWGGYQGNRLPFKDLTHPFNGGISLRYSLYQITGDASWLNEANLQITQFRNNTLLTLNGDGSYMWDHRVEGYSHTNMGWQNSEYGSSTTLWWLVLYQSGFPGVSRTDMNRIASTFDNITSHGTTTIDANVNPYDGLNGGFTDTKFAINPGVYLIPFNADLKTQAQAIYDADGTYAERNIFIPAGMVLDAYDDFRDGLNR
jgi:hypothetical protein